MPNMDSERRSESKNGSRSAPQLRVLKSWAEKPPLFNEQNRRLWDKDILFRKRGNDMLSLNSGPITGQDWCLLTNKSAAIVLRIYMASKIDNFDINMVGSRQKLQFISKQNNFQTENVYTFAMPTRELL